MLDTPLDLIQATVQLEQPKAEGRRTLGTGFLVSARTEDGEPAILLVTAHHVLAGMPASEAGIGYRTMSAEGRWRFKPAVLKIRDAAGAPLWTRHPAQDVAVIRIEAPAEFAKAAIPVSYLAPASDTAKLAPGDELLVLGFPRGFAANDAGFPILRAGRVASYPVSPDWSATFLLDFSVFPGNSGGPVFVTRSLRPASAGGSKPFIAGILTQQVQHDNERLEIGIVTHARYIAETIDLVQGVRRGEPDDAKVVAASQPLDVGEVPGAEPVSVTPERSPGWSRPLAAVRAATLGFRRAAADTLRQISRRLILWLDPGPAKSFGQGRESEV